MCEQEKVFKQAEVNARARCEKLVENQPEVAWGEVTWDALVAAEFKILVLQKKQREDSDE